MLRIKDIDRYDLNDPKRTIHHREIIKSKKFLYRLYVDWYEKIKALCADAPSGKIIELGSGGGFLKEIFPEIRTSDIMDIPGNDYTFNALKMPFEDNSISAFVMVDVFHHVPDSHLFLSEMQRCLKPGGLVVMSEPCNTAWGRVIFQNFHHEPFNPEGDWTIPGSGPMSDANGALPWIVLQRDEAKFKNNFPDFKVLNREYHSPLTYLLSGGVSFKQLVPNISYMPLRYTEKVIQRIFPKFALFQFVKLKYL